ncbi:MBG domain-containing protein [Schleiferilactobacillus perolens]|uniref:MBG domain-containing protein n=1 Tax=Schleiferilactobacillus perolens DSM 12744 TaxID=1423792 RepID=A0A0R1N0B4_9LACO|nr:MBG domain-containing protein [Schleiferilactobacillus perolens]KRL10794.1 hypothetical protein FD09_GL000940 [Schleiferilactobacillus perolens DSM 12744]
MSETHVHFKLHKVKKHWLVIAASVTFSLAAAMGTTRIVHGDEIKAENNTATVDKNAATTPSATVALQAAENSVASAAGAAEEESAAVPANAASNSLNTVPTQTEETPTPPTQTATATTPVTSATPAVPAPAKDTAPGADDPVKSPEAVKETTPTSQAGESLTATTSAATPAPKTDEAAAEPAKPVEPTNTAAALATAKALSEQGGTFQDWIPDANFRDQVLTALHANKLLPANQGADAVTPTMIQTLASLQLGDTIPAKAADGVPATDVLTANPQTSVNDLTGIGMFTGLKQLTLTDNAFKTIPKEINQLTQLTDLTITRNTQLTNIEDLSELQNVTKLAITNNSQLTQLTPTLNDLTNVTGTLDLHGNSLTALPDLSNLQKVTTLDLNNNRLTDISDGHLDQLTNLTTLNLGSYDGANYTEFVTGLGHDLNSGGGNLSMTDFVDAVPNQENNVHLDYDPTVQAPNMTLKDAQGKPTYAYPSAFTTPDKAHYNHLTSLPDNLSSLVNLQKLNLIGNDLTDLPNSFAALTQLTDLRLGNNRFTAIPAAVQQLLGSNPQLNVSFSNYLANYPSFGTYRNQNGILQSQIWKDGKFLINGWDPARDQVLSQVVKFPQHYVVAYNSTSYTIMNGAVNPYVPTEKINDSQMIPIGGLFGAYYLGPEALTADPNAKTGVVVQQFVHYPNNMTNGTDRNGNARQPSMNPNTFGNGYYGGLYGATNDVLTVGEANKTKDANGHDLPLYPYQDPYVNNPAIHVSATTWRGLVGNTFYYMILLPRDWSPDKDNLGKTYALNFSIGGKYRENAPDGGASNGTGMTNGFVQPDATGYSMVATTDVTFVEDGALSVTARNSTVAQGHPWDPAQGFVSGTRNDTNKTTINNWYDTQGKANPELGVQLYEVLPQGNGSLAILQKFKDVTDFNQNATAYRYADNLHMTYATDTNGNRIPRYYFATYQYLDKESSLAQIVITDQSTLSLQDSHATVKTPWQLSDAQFKATDPDGQTPLTDAVDNTTDQVTMQFVDDADPTVVFNDVATFNAGKQAGHTYTVTAKTYDLRAETGLSTQLFFLKDAAAKITVAKDKISYTLSGTESKVADGQPAILNPGQYHVTLSTGETYQPITGDLAFADASSPTAPGTYPVILTPAGDTHVQAVNPDAEWTSETSTAIYVITPAPTKPETPGGGCTPTTPVEPEKPTTPVEPEKPVTPVEPEKPVVPEEPEKPTEPAKPVPPTEPEDGKVPEVTRESHIKTPNVPVIIGKPGLTKTRSVMPHTLNLATQVGMLPQTDEKSSGWLAVFGMIISLLAGWRFVRHHDEKE